MQTSVDLPDALFEKSAAIAASNGTTVEQFIVEAVTKEIYKRDAQVYCGDQPDLPVIRSRNPGLLDLSDFNFDDLLA
jgi:hypothetical protein